MVETTAYTATDSLAYVAKDDGVSKPHGALNVKARVRNLIALQHQVLQTPGTGSKPTML
jgi:hypothetical protein